MSTVIYHNPKCSTSRNALAALREAGHTPTIIEYLKNPPTRAELVALLAAAGRTPATAVRKRETLYKELNLVAASDTEILDAMVAHPILIERPIVVTAKGTCIPRPMSTLTDIL